MTTLSNEQLREKLETLYNEATMMGRLRTGSPITHMVDGAIDILTSQRQAILNEVREGAQDFKIAKIISGYFTGEETVKAIPLAHLDAMEKKYKGGEETPKEKR